MTDVEVHRVLEWDTNSVQPFETEQHLVTTTTVGIGVEADVFVDELFSLFSILEEPSSTFPICTETQVGHITDDLTLTGEWCKMGDVGPGDTSQGEINSNTRPHVGPEDSRSSCRECCLSKQNIAPDADPPEPA